MYTVKISAKGLPVKKLTSLLSTVQVPEEDIVSVTDMLQDQRKEPATS